MKIIFLDIDGVLVLRGFKAETSSISALNNIVASTQAKIVLSSSWRQYGYERMIEVFQEWGIAARPWAFTPNYNGEPYMSYGFDRDLEIIGYLKRHTFEMKRKRLELIESYCVLDDEIISEIAFDTERRELAYSWGLNIEESDVKQLRDRHIQTIPTIGLATDHIDVAISILNTPFGNSIIRNPLYDQI